MIRRLISINSLMVVIVIAQSFFSFPSHAAKALTSSFTAPAVNSGGAVGLSTTLVDPHVGDIVYESSSNVFYGYGLTGGWQALGEGNNAINVNAKYYLSVNGTTITSGNPINFDTQLFDSTASVTTGANWKFTAPVAGVYNVSVNFSTASVVSLLLAKNGSSYNYLFTVPAANYVASGSTLVNLNAGDYINVSPDGTNTAVVTGFPNCVISINRVGN